MHQLAEVLTTRISGIFWMMVIAFAIERFLPVETTIRARGLLVNCVVGFFFLFAQELSLLGLGFLIVGPHSGLVPFLGVSDGGSVARAFGLFFCWMVLRDFFYYWLHRMQHASKWLWAEHAVHHSEEHMNVTTSVRHHWLEHPLTIMLVNAPLFLLFRPPVITLVAVATIVGLTEFSNHMNFRLGLGRFSWLIATPQAHRIHHSILKQHEDKNFAAFFPMWDVIFGTYYAPQKDEYPPTGLSSGERVNTVAEALLLPFRMWAKMLRRSEAPQQEQLEKLAA